MPQNFNSERIIKIRHYLPKLCSNERVQFFDSQCTRLDTVDYYDTIQQDDFVCSQEPKINEKGTKNKQCQKSKVLAAPTLILAACKYISCNIAN